MLGMTSPGVREISHGSTMFDEFAIFITAISLDQDACAVSLVLVDLVVFLLYTLYTYILVESC